MARHHHPAKDSSSLSFCLLCGQRHEPNQDGVGLHCQSHHILRFALLPRIGGTFIFLDSKIGTPLQDRLKHFDDVPKLLDELERLSLIDDIRTKRMPRQQISTMFGIVKQYLIASEYDSLETLRQTMRERVGSLTGANRHRLYQQFLDTRSIQELICFLSDYLNHVGPLIERTNRHTERDRLEVSLITARLLLAEAVYFAETHPNDPEPVSSIQPGPPPSRLAAG
jgi:hypothetical protein